jgi:cystathionine beta-lyase
MVESRINQMPGCRLYPIESTYLAWIDVRNTGLDDPVHFFEAAGVGLSDGKYFGQKGFVRLNFGCPKAILEKGLNRMETALKNLSSR